MGDAVDNVPGVDKVGPKTAAKLLQEYGSLDGVMAHAAEVKGVVGRKPAQGARLAAHGARAGHGEDRRAAALRRGDAARPRPGSRPPDRALRATRLPFDAGGAAEGRRRRSWPAVRRPRDRLPPRPQPSPTPSAAPGQPAASANPTPLPRMKGPRSSRHATTKRCSTKPRPRNGCAHRGRAAHLLRYRDHEPRSDDRGAGGHLARVDRGRGGVHPAHATATPACPTSSTSSARSRA